MSASKACPVCGALNDPTNAYCISCGRPLFATPTASPPPTPYPSATTPAVPPAVAYPYFPSPLPRHATAGAILSGIFDVWTKNFANFFVVFFVLGLVNGLIGGLLGLAIYGTFGPATSLFPGGPPSGVPTVALGNILFFLILYVLAGAVVNSFVTGGMSEYAVRRFRGESITLERALRRGLERFLSILGANILLTLLTLGLVFVPLLLIFLPFAAGGTVNPATAIGAICGGLVLLVVGSLVALYVGIAMSLYSPAIMMENANATGGLMRSWRITKRHWWSIFGAFLVMLILSSVISGAIGLPFAFLRNPYVTILATAIASGIVGGLFVILASIAYDLLVRQPSFGPPTYYPGVTMAPPAGAAQAPPPPPAPPSPPGP